MSKLKYAFATFETMDLSQISVWMDQYCRQNGISADQLADYTGEQPHTIRSIITGGTPPTRGVLEYFNAREISVEVDKTRVITERVKEIHYEEDK